MRPRREKIDKDRAERARQRSRTKLKNNYIESLTEEELTVLLADLIDEMSTRSERHNPSPALLFRASKTVER